jgi:RNA recognition motif-containing protein
MDNNTAKLFIGNLPYEITEEELNDLFSQYGEVKEVFAPRQKGYAFVTFANPEDAQKALEAMKDYELKGRKLNIDMARAKSRDDNGGDRRGGGGSRGGFNSNRGFRDRGSRY